MVIPALGSSWQRAQHQLTTIFIRCLTSSLPASSEDEQWAQGEVTAPPWMADRLLAAAPGMQRLRIPMKMSTPAPGKILTTVNATTLQNIGIPIVSARPHLVVVHCLLLWSDLYIIS